MTDIDFEKFEQLSEEEKKSISSKWTDEDWGKYYMNGGAVSIDDFFQELEDETIKMAQEKYKTQTNDTIFPSVSAEQYENQTTAKDVNARETHSQSRLTVYLNKKYKGKFKAEEHPRSKNEWSSKDWDAYMFNDGVLDHDEAFADLNELLSSDSSPRQHIVFLTGAGVSAESGIETFRGEDGMWTDKERIRLSSAGALYYDTEKCLNFYNALRKRIAEAEPNDAHRIIARLEEEHEVTVITQNVDNLHERAGSSRVIHLHGELTKVCSSNNRTTCIKEYPLDVPIRVGDKAEDGSQLRPAVVMFGEYVGDTDEAVNCICNADIFVVIGTSLSIHPAGGLIRHANHEIPKFVIDPADMDLCVQLGFTHIKATATEGMLQLMEALNDLLDPGSEPIQDMEH